MTASSTEPRGWRSANSRNGISSLTGSAPLGTLVEEVRALPGGGIAGTLGSALAADFLDRRREAFGVSAVESATSSLDVATLVVVRARVA